MKKQIAVLGSGGMLGSDLVAALRAGGFGVSPWCRPTLDITDAAGRERAVAGAEVVINCAAWTDVDGAETHADQARAVNTEAPGALGELLASTGALLIHVSTDFVFDGRRMGGYRESDSTAPLNVYGRTKLAGEEAIRRSGCRACILRLQWTYGRHGSNFVTRICERARGGGELTVVTDQRGAPTATADAAAVLCRLAAGEMEGCYHYAAAGAVSKYALARYIVNRLGLPATVRPCDSTAWSAAAPRPRNSVFDCGRIEAATGVSRRAWRISLDPFLEHLQ